MAGKAVLLVLTAVVLVVATAVITLLVTRNEDSGDLVVRRSFSGCDNSESRYSCVSRLERLLTEACDNRQVAAVDLSVNDSPAQTVLCDDVDEALRGVDP